MEKIVASVSRQLHAPVVDRAALAAIYDVNILFRPGNRSPNVNADTPVLSIEQAFQEDLGLKLERTKGAIEVLVIDHMEKPDSN